MLISVIHFSDIHFKKGHNIVLNRKEKIFNSIKNDIKGKDKCFIITSGDIAFSGQKEEYEIALEFYKYLFQHIKSYCGVEAYFLFVPGNHDLHFDEKNETLRKIILKNFAEKGLDEISEDLINLCCIPQASFVEFTKKLQQKLSYNGDIIFNHPLLQIISFKFNDYIIKFNCFNTSWDSSLKEKIGNLKFPIEYLYDQIPTVTNNLSISILHHPFNWQTPEYSKDFRESLIKTSEIIITGHEHSGNTSMISDFNSEYNTIHIESDALQGDNEKISAFNLINIDTASNSLILNSYKYDINKATYQSIMDCSTRQFSKEKKLKSRLFQLKKYYQSEIENPGATFSHPNVDEIKLADIYVPPFFNNVTNDKIKKTKFFNFIHSDSALTMDENERKEKLITSTQVENKEENKKYLKLVLGSEGSGKTAILKHHFAKFLAKGLYPIYINTDHITDVQENKLKRFVLGEFKKQYDELDGVIEEVDLSEVVILIDDMHRFKNKKSKVALIRNLCRIYEHILITGNDVMLFETYTDNKNQSIELFESFDRYIIQEFNPTLRYQLINKWYRLGKDYLDTDERNDFYKRLDTAALTITTIIGKNLIPAYPFYILSILQAFEAGDSDSTDTKLHAYYYEMLITKALKKALPDKEDIGFYMTFAKEYFYFLFSEKIRFKGLNKDGFKLIVSRHAKKYKISKINSDVILETMIRSKILKYDSIGEISMTYKYLYYYFVAKYISDSIDNKEIQKVIDSMADRLYRDEYSNIILFLTHLTKNNYVVNKLVEKARLIYKEYAPAKLESDIDFINELQESLPTQVLESMDVDQARTSNLEDDNETEAYEKDLEEKNLSDSYDLDEDISSIDFISNFTKAIRTITILGQLTKKYWGELLGEEKYNLAEETFLLGLRTLSFHYGIIKSDPAGMVEHISKMIEKRFIKEKLTKEQIKNYSANFIFMISSAASFAIIKKIINAIGTEKLSDTFEDIADNYQYNSVKLTTAGIKLDHYNSFPLRDIEELKNDNQKNPLGFSTLQNLVTEYIYMFELPIERKQQICEMLNIKINEQRVISETTQIKK